MFTSVFMTRKHLIMTKCDSTTFFLIKHHTIAGMEFNSCRLFGRILKNEWKSVHHFGVHTVSREAES